MAIGIIWADIWDETIWNTAIWAQEAGESDTTPDQFSFTDQSGVAVDTEISSAAITVAGIDAAAAITVTGGTYSINGGAFTADAGTVDNGDEVRARHTSSASYLTATDTVVTIGGVSDTFTSTTRADPADASWIIGGTAVNSDGVMGTLFLDDETSVPSTAVMFAGFAHTPEGFRYVAAWPVSDAVTYNRGIATRNDGAMVIDPAGVVAVFIAGTGLTSRGEVVASTDAPDVIKAGFGHLNDGSLCIAEAA